MGSLFGKTPKPEKPTPMPDEQELGKARQRRISKEQEGQTVQSTILSSAGREKLGG